MSSWSFGICLILILNLIYMNAQNEQFLTPQQIKDVANAVGAFNAVFTGINAPLVQPDGSPFEGIDITPRDGILAFVFATLLAIDDYIANPVLFNPITQFFSESGLDKIGLVKFLESLIAFVNSSDYTFVHAGVEKRVVTCLKDLKL